MKLGFKKLFPLLILLLMVLVLPQALASDVDNATELTSEIAIDEPAIAVENDYDDVMASDNCEDSEDAIYVSTEGNDKNDGSFDAPYATIYRASNEAMDSGKSNIYIKEGTYKENSIPIETSVNIVGLGNVIIDAEKIDRIFKISGEYEITLSNLTLINGVGSEYTYYDDHDGWITIYKGGAIDIEGAYVKMNHMTFINNTADDFGGAINVEAPYCEINNSVFISNYAGVFGGAIDFEDDYGIVNNCTFIYNEAGNGGAIGYIGAAGTIINSLFENNTAENGAAVFIENAELTFDGSNEHVIKNNSFIHNEAIQQGGAIEVENQQMSENADWTLIDGNEFIDNYAFNGGAISAYYGDAGITNNLFKDNSAGYGGAIAAISTTDSAYIIVGGIYLKNNTMINCIAEENGNTIYNVGYYGTAINITFINGRTIYSKDGKAVILNVTVCDDMGNPISGSPIDFTVNGKATINPATDLTEGFGTVRFVPRENGTFVVSGVLTNKKFNLKEINLVTGNIVVENAIADYFGTIHVSESDGDDDNTGAEDSPVKTFNQAYILATRDGGSFSIVLNKGTYSVLGYALEQSFNLTGIDNPVLDGKNQATLFTFNGKPNSEFHISGLTFINGVASSSKYAGINEGGAIFLKGGTLYLDNSTFSGNSANDYGGAVYLNKGFDLNSGGSYRAFGYINNCTFNSNVAKYYGGAIGLYDCEVVVSNCYFNSNKAKNGGAISTVNGMGNLTVINSTFIKNDASEYGGALDVDALSTYNVKYFAKVYNSKFLENTAKYGGAIVAGHTEISDSLFTKNSADIYGGAIFTNGTEFMVEYSIFENNEASEGSSYYGYSNFVNNNFWGVNFDDSDEIKESSIVVIKNDTESRPIVHGDVVNDTNVKSWVNVEIAGPKKILPGNYVYAVRFVLNNGSDLENSLPKYVVKVNSKNNINESSIQISNKDVLLDYSADKEGIDAISIFSENTNSLIASLDINVHVKMNTALSVENKSFSVVDNSKSINVVLKDSKGNSVYNKNVIVHVDGNNYTALTDKDGSAVFNLSLNKSGNFDVYVEFIGDDDYNCSTSTSVISVVKLATKLTVPKKTFLATSKSKAVTITLKDSKGNLLKNKKVTFKIGTKSYNRITNNKGQATLKITYKKAKSYKMTVKFGGDDYYLSKSGTSTIKINKVKTKMSISKKTYKKSAKSKKLTAVLKSSSGKALAKKKVTFTVNGKKYTAKTNSKGKATVKVKLTAKKTYKVTVKFAGDSQYKATSKKSSVKIK